jgi:hypothetical protein
LIQRPASRQTRSLGAKASSLHLPVAAASADLLAVSNDFLYRWQGGRFEADGEFVVAGGAR